MASLTQREAKRASTLHRNQSFQQQPATLGVHSLTVGNNTQSELRAREEREREKQPLSIQYLTMSKSGMDVLLQQRGKALQTGESIRFRLIKGPTTAPAKDPVSTKAPFEAFPQILKFGESVVKPDFAGKPWNKSRLYQQDTPKAQDDSDEEAASASAPTRKKRWRRPDAPKRQWILQEQQEFLETMIAKRQKKVLDNNRISSRYEGTAEFNASQYVVMSVVEGEDNTITVTPLPPKNAVQSFSQPAKMHTMTMTEAEQAIQDQRGKMTRFMMHKSAAVNGTKSRLMGKLSKNAEAGEEDDVMGDVAFRSRKGAGNKARRELLTSLADEGMTVDDDGVLGGTNDAEFGGKRHFGRLNVDKEQQKEKKAAKGANATGVGNDGLAMADDFYQRDVQAEYEELDYDANELFDDDDVDLGEGEVQVDTGGFAAENEDEDEEDFLEETQEGAEGLATVAGFKLLLAKARGETPQTEEATEEAKKDEEEKDDSKKRPVSPPSPQAPVAAEAPSGDALASIQAAAAAAAQAAAQKDKPEKKHTGVELDENGQRLVTLEAIRREIWLHHGSIRVKRLMKIFDINKKKTTKERFGKFMDLIKELCVITNDPVDGRILVLKQHYSNMG